MQSKSIYLYTNESRAGSRLIAMGLMEMLKYEVQDVAYFKPIIHTDAQKDEDITFFKSYFPLKQPIQSAYGITLLELKEWIEKDQLHHAYEQILERFSALEKEYDFILSQSVDNRDIENFLDVDINIEIAKNLPCSLLCLLNSKDVKTPQEIVQKTQLMLLSLQKHALTPQALFLNRIDPPILEETREEISQDIPTFCLPEAAELDLPTIEEIATHIKATILTQDTLMLDRSVKQSKVAAMHVEHYLDYLQEGDLIIVPGDRHDIAIATYLANLSKNYPFIAGLLFTGGMQPPPNIISLIEGANLPILPMLSIDTDTQSAAILVQEVSPHITLSSQRKISLAIGLFNRYVDINRFKTSLTLSHAQTMTPVRFIYALYEKARHKKCNILLPESDDDRILRAAEIVLRRGLCDITLLGDAKVIKQKSSALGLDLSKATIINPHTFEKKEAFAEKFYALRKDKGVILPMAREYMSRMNYFATMLLYEGYVDGMVSGATHTTRETIKPAFEIIKMKADTTLISSVFFMLLEDRVLVYADCAINPDPDAKALAHIAINSAQTAQKFGIKPRVAMLSYSSGSSGKGTDVQKIQEATLLAQKMAPDLPIEGPLQYDAAIDPHVAARKMPQSHIAGKATVFIFPDLNTGNNTYKAVQRSANAVAIGPILQGLKKPVNDLSRGCLTEDIVYTIAITAIQAAKV